MKKIATFLIIVGLSSFVCLVIKQPASLLPWFIVSYFAVASVLIFLVAQLLPVKKGETDRRKWVITGGIIGIISPSLFFLSFLFPILMQISFACPYLYNICIALFPFSIVLMLCEYIPATLSWLLLICTIILNIGLFALLGLLLGTIVRGITRVIRKS